MKKKGIKKVVLMAMVVFGVFALFGCSGKLDVPTKDIEATNEVAIGTLVEVPEKYKDRVEILNADEIVALNELGKKEITYKVKDKQSGKEDEVIVEFNIVDTTGPEIKCKNNISIIKGKKFNINKYAKAEDIVDGKIETINVTGEVNTKKLGKYELTLSAEDKSGNKTEKKVTVKVKEKPMTLDEFYSMVDGNWYSDAYYYDKESGQKMQNHFMFFTKDEGGYRFWLGDYNSLNMKNGYANSIKKEGNIVTLNMNIDNQVRTGLSEEPVYDYNEKAIIKIDISNIKNNKIKLVVCKDFENYENMIGTYSRTDFSGK